MLKHQHDIDPFKVSSPRIFLVRMLVFLVLGGLLVVILYRQISAAFLALVEDGLLRRQRREPAVTRRIARVRRDLDDLAKALDR